MIKQKKHIMNKSIKHSLLLCLFFLPFLINAQEVITPIKAKKTTDPNYQKNIEKSKAYVPFVKKPHTTLIKDKAYYTKLIQELKIDIAKREKNADPNDRIATGKIIRKKDELYLAEQNLKKITQEN